jgi:EAL domain-containing protein (putative c-di-GMP-specific phosphodiesterase class I)/CHASE2 domain-containing sensor protein
VSTHKQRKAARKPWKLILWTAIAGLVFGLIGFGEVAEDFLRAARNSLHWHKASGDIVVVQIDDRSLREVSRWPWPRRYDAQLVDALTKAGARRIFIDLAFMGATSPRDDATFADSLRRSGRAYLAVRLRSGPETGTEIDGEPLPEFSRNARLGTISVRYNYQNATWRIPYELTSSGKAIPSFAALLAGKRGAPGETFIPDYSIDPATIPAISASALLKGEADPLLVRGKDVVIGGTAEAVDDQYFIPGTGKMGGVYVHVIGAETLKSGRPVYLGWVPLFLIGLGLGAFATLRRSPLQQSITLGAGLTGLFVVPTMFEARLIFMDVTPALFVLLVVSGALTRRRFRERGFVNPISNLPNLNAFRANREGRNQVVIAARIMNYEEIVASLPPSSERKLVEQIVSRLALGAPKRTLYQGDGGIFAWFEESRDPIGNHLEALYTLFRNPARVGELAIDLAIAFGVEVGSGRSLASRLASALVAAEEAAHDGLKWKYHNPESLEDASWKLSMLSQLDAAIDEGQVWVAYQPKFELSTRRIVGAEALARWTHPEKGPIAATEFVAAAEQHNRIAKLTDFVLEKAVMAATQINKRGTSFNVAVNLSARLLSDKGFTLRLSALLARHGLDPSYLTLELTETAALAGTGEGFDMIARLRDLGVKISIDDYGTGLSTLEYLKKVPADEIKIDQSFVKGIADNRSDRLMVQSTIGLAHSLGRKVVAEGVEDREILEVLTTMGCDIAQGYAVGRPMSMESLVKRIAVDRKRSAA